MVQYIIIGVLIVALFVVTFFVKRNKVSTISPEVLNAAAEGFVKSNLIGLINLLSACYCSMQNIEEDISDEELVNRLIDYAYITINELSVVYDIDISCIDKIPKENIKDAIFTVYNNYKYLITNLEQGDTVVGEDSDYVNMYVVKANSFKETLDDFLKNVDTKDPFASDEPEEFDPENYV